MSTTMHSAIIIKANHQQRLFGLFFIMLLLLALAMLWMKGLPPHVLPQLLPIRHVTVEGQFQRLDPKTLKARSAGIVNGGFFNVNVDAIREHLLAEPWVHSVTVRRVWSDTLALHVSEQSPVSIWNDHRVINEEGLLFTPPVASIPAGLPALSGPAGTHLELLGLLAYLNEQLHTHELQVTRLAMDARRSLSFTLSNGSIIIIGNKGIAIRLARFLQHVPARLNIARINRVDMRYPNGFAIENKTIEEDGQH